MKLTTIAAAAALAVASMSASAATYVPGTYTYKVNAHNAAMTVVVTVSKHKIEKIDWSKNLETIGVGQLALEKVGGRILEKQSLGVDGVTGATISSMALKYAVGECLKQAKVSVEDLKDLKKNVEEYKALPNTMKTQVVIIGGGGSGLAAAVAASQAGADVIVLEKLGLHTELYRKQVPISKSPKARSMRPTRSASPSSASRTPLRNTSTRRSRAATTWATPSSSNTSVKAPIPPSNGSNRSA